MQDTNTACTGSHCGFHAQFSSKAELSKLFCKDLFPKTSAPGAGSLGAT